MTYSLGAAMRRLFSVIATGLLALGPASEARALSGYLSLMTHNLGDCSMIIYRGAYTQFLVVNYNTGTQTFLGPYWNYGNAIDLGISPLTAELLTDCGFSNVRNLKQDFANGSYGTDPYFGFSFVGAYTSADPDAAEMFYEVALKGASNTQFVGVERPVGAPPVVDTLQDQDVASNATVTLGASATDPDGDDLSYQWSPDPSNSVSVELTDAGSATATFTAPSVPAGSEPLALFFTLTVSDGLNDVTQTVKVSVQPAANHPPSVTIPAQNLVLTAGGTLTLGAVGSDQDNQTLTYSWRQIDQSGVTASFDDATSASPTISVPKRPRQGDVFLNFQVTVSDGVDTATDAVDVTLTSPNNAPTVTDDPTHFVHPGASVTLSVTASDLDGDNLTYFWRRTAGVGTGVWDAPLYPGAYTTANPTITIPDDLTNIPPEGVFYAFDVDVSDGFETRTGTARVLLTAAEQPITVTLVSADTAVHPGDQVTITSSVAGNNLNGLTYEWTQIDDSKTSVISPEEAGQRDLTFTAPERPRGGPPVTLTFRLTVTNEAGESGYSDYNVEVSPLANTAPRITSISQGTVIVAGETGQLSVSAEDDDGDPLEYNWTYVDDAGISGVVIDAPTAQETGFTTPRLARYAEAEGLHFRVAVSDGVDTTEADVYFTLNPPFNNPPLLRVSAPQDAAPNALVDIFADADDLDGGAVSLTLAQSGGVEVMPNEVDPGHWQFYAPNLSATDPAEFLKFRVTVVDDYGASVFEDITVKVKSSANQPPQIVMMTRKELFGGQSTSLYVAASDNDGDVLTYLWEQVDDTGLTVAPVDATLSFTSVAVPALTKGSASKTLVYRVTVSDGTDSVQGEVGITILAPPNTLPTVDAGGDREVFAGSGVALQATGNDGDGDTLSYRWRQTDGTGVEVTLNHATSRNANFNAPVLARNTPPKDLVFEVTADDGYGGVATDTVTITLISPVNTVPNIVEVSSPTVTAKEAGALSVVAEDADLDTLSYSWAQDADDAYQVSLSGSDGASPGFTAPDIPQGANVVLHFTVTVSDPYGSTVADTTVTVVPAQNAPPSVTPMADATADSGQMVELSVDASDPDGDTLSYLWEQVDSSGVAVPVSDGKAERPTILAPPVDRDAQALVLSYRVTVSDGTASVQQRVNVTVRPRQNVPPLVNAGQNISTVSGERVVFDPLVDDPDGDTLTYRWKQVGPVIVEARIENATDAKASFVAPDVSQISTSVGPEVDFVFELTVEDGHGGTNSSRVIVTVSPKANAAPDAVLELVGNTDNVITLTGENSTDPDKDTLSLSWRQTDGPTVEYSTFPDGTLEFGGPALTWQDDPVSYTFELKVEDPGGLSDTASLTVTVNPPARPDLVADFLMGATTVAGGETITFNAVISRGDGANSLTYSWETDLPGFTIPATVKPTVRTPVPVQDQVVSVTLTVTEDAGGPHEREARVTKTFTLTGIAGPALQIAGPRKVTEGEAVTLDASGTTGGYGAKFFEWRQTSGPMVALSYGSSANDMISFVAPEVPEGSDSVDVGFEVAVTDLNRQSDKQLVTVTVTRKTGDNVAEEVIRKESRIRLANLISNQPDLDGVLGGGDGTADVTISSMGGDLDLGTAPDQPYWLRLKGSWSNLEGAEAAYFLGAAGTHVKLGDGLALGVMGQVDHQSMTDGAAKTRGTGWLVGPYVVARLPDQPLTVQGRLLYGQTANSISPTGTYTDRFGSTRMLAQMGISGRIAKDQVVWTPSLSASYGVDRSEAYTDSLGAPVAAQTDAVAQVATGLQVRFPLPVASGTMTGTLGLADVWSRGMADAAGSALDGHRGRVSFAANRAFASGAELSLTGSYDGIGSSGYRNLSLDLLYEHKF